MLKKRIDSFKYAFTGIFDLFRSQVNAKIHLLMAFAVIVCGWFFGISIMEWCLVVICMGLVLAAEAFNTAIEYLTDLVSPEYHELAGKTKDVGAAGVLLMAIASAVVGLLIFLPKFWEMFF